MGIDVLTDNRRVVHQDAERHDEGKQRQHIDCLIHRFEHQESAHKRYRYPESHPERQAKV